MENNLEIKIPKTLNEHVLGKCNLEYPEKDPEVNGSVSITYAKALHDRKELEKKLDDDFKEQDKNMKEFAKETANVDLKESLNEDIDQKGIKAWANQAMDALEEFLNEAAKGSPEEIGLSTEDLSTIGDAYDILGDMIFMMDQKFDESVEKVEETEEEEIVEETASEVEKDYRNKKGDLLGDQLEDDKDILWMRVYDELSTEVSGVPMRDMDRQVKAARGERYEQVFPSNDGIVIWETDPEKFEFAKKVADHYGLETRGPVESKMKIGNPYYKWKFNIII